MGWGLHVRSSAQHPVQASTTSPPFTSPLLTLRHLTVPLWSRPLPVLRQALRQKHQEAQQACRPHNLPVLQAAQQRELEVGVWAWGGPTCTPLTGPCGGDRSGVGADLGWAARA